MSEGSGLGLFSISNYTIGDLLPNVPRVRSLQYLHLERDVLWSRALFQLYRAVPLAFDLLEDWRVDPFSQDRFSFSEYGGLDTYLHRDRHTYGEYVLTRGMLIDDGFDLLPWLHLQQIQQFGTFLRSASCPLNRPAALLIDGELSVWHDIDASARQGIDESEGENEIEADELSDSDKENIPPLIEDVPDTPRQPPDDSDDDGSSPASSIYYQDPPQFNMLDLFMHYTSDDGLFSGSDFEAGSGSDFTLDKDLQKATHRIQKLFIAALRPAKKTVGSGDQAGPDIVALERNAARVKTFDRLCPPPLVVVVKINGQPCCALLDSGSLSDFISTTLADQLKLELKELKKPLPLQLAVSGSRSKVKVQTLVDFEYQNISELRKFDIINLDSYDIILGTPFMFQHQVLLGFNPSQVKIRSLESLPIQGSQVLALESRATMIASALIEGWREELRQYAGPICKEAVETGLPPLRAINHTIPLINDGVVYKQRPSRCPEMLRPIWNEKRDAYLKTGRWEFRSGVNAVPMLMLRKPTKD
ncbi:hypothetical protein HWV62_5606, partial [Athelia sp. TMB]